MLPDGRIIGLSGKKRSGKDTVGQILVEKRDYRTVAFADPLRDVLLAMNPLVSGSYNVRLDEVINSRGGWDGFKDRYPDEYRRLMTGLGSDGIKKIDPNFFADAVAKRINVWGKTVVTDVRFEEEVVVLKRLGGEIWRITRPATDQGAGDHSSETELDHYSFDRYIQNDSDMYTLTNRVLDAERRNSLVPF